jgi:hypothetical protein
MADEILRDMLKLPATPPEPTVEPTDAELDAATDAYVASRWNDAREWRKSYPAQWQETRDRIKVALQAAAKVRGAWLMYKS